MSRLSALFAQTRAEGRGALIVYVTAGDPDLETTREVVLAAERGGADAVELGIPFSDPLADGPVIQAASFRALQGGTTVRGVLRCLAEIRERSQLPIAFMSCINPLLHMGLDEFAAAAGAAGGDGVLVTDLPPSESSEWVRIAAQHHLETIFLVAPSSTEARIESAVELTTGFVYCVARPGVTGTRDELPADLAALVQRIRARTDKPIAVGFGVSQPEHVRQVCAVADGAVVGSAVVRVVAEGDPQGARDRVERFVAELAAGVSAS